MPFCVCHNHCQCLWLGVGEGGGQGKVEGGVGVGKAGGVRQFDIDRGSNDACVLCEETAGNADTD